MKCFRCHKDMSDIDPDHDRVCDGGYMDNEGEEWFCAEEPETVFDVYWWIRNSAPPAADAMNAIERILSTATARAALDERDNLDLLIYLRDKAYSMDSVPNIITVGNRQAVITNLSIYSPEADGEMLGEGNIEIKYILVTKTS